MPDIDMIQVSSSNVESIGYDENSQILRVRFLTGATYDYINVPEFEFEQLKVAASVGSYLHRNIKNVYPYQRIG